MKIIIKPKKLISAILLPVSLLTIHSCYDFDALREDPYALIDHSNSTGTDTETEDDTKYADINLSFKVSKEDSVAYRTDLAGAAVHSAVFFTMDTITIIRLQQT